MKRYPAFEPPEYVAWKADPELVRAFRDTVNRLPERQGSWRGSPATNS